jgi:hypothetical protein
MLAEVDLLRIAVFVMADGLLQANGEERPAKREGRRSSRSELYGATVLHPARKEESDNGLHLSTIRQCIETSLGALTHRL